MLKDFLNLSNGGARFVQATSTTKRRTANLVKNVKNSIGNPEQKNYTQQNFYAQNSNNQTNLVNKVSNRTSTAAATTTTDNALERPVAKEAITMTTTDIGKPGNI